ncbi:MAG: GntP family permease [Methanomicrobiaceae archaeon]|nr:GntP family permease [Methanomicrobiaceae archaeon]
MDPLVVLILTLILITVLAFSRRVPAFLVLITGAIFLGLIAGFNPDQVLKWTAEGMGEIFSSFAIVILSGMVIARLLLDQRLLDVIVSGISGRIKTPAAGAGIIGFILSVPTTCCITTYLMIAPAFKGQGDESSGSNKPLYLVAIGSIISYVLIFPTPATMPLLSNLGGGCPAYLFNAVTIPLSLAILAIVILLSGFWYGKGFSSPETGEKRVSEYPLKTHLRAWTPFIAIIGAVPVGVFLLQLSHLGLVQFIMLAGLISTLAFAPRDIRMKGFSAGAKSAGLILFDFCSAGAIGKVIIGSGLAGGIVDSLIPVVPVIMVPFIIAAVFATAQGSRVVTAVIASQIIGTTEIIQQVHPLPLILMVSAGTCFIPYLTDPYFWLIQRTTGDDIGTVLRNYTLPLAFCGLIMLSAAIFLSMTFYPDPMI